MSSTQPRNSSDILLEETKTITNNGVSHDAEVTQTNLAQKIDDFMLKLGYSNAHVLGVVIQLLTRGKVRVDFRDYTERIEIVGGMPLMDRSQAVLVFDAHIAKNRKADDSSELDATQKIMVQPPRATLPRRIS